MADPKISLPQLKTFVLNDKKQVTVKEAHDNIDKIIKLGIPGVTEALTELKKNIDATKGDHFVTEDALKALDMQDEAGQFMSDGNLTKGEFKNVKLDPPPAPIPPTNEKIKPIKII